MYNHNILEARDKDEGWDLVVKNTSSSKHIFPTVSLPGVPTNYFPKLETSISISGKQNKYRVRPHMTATNLIFWYDIYLPVTAFRYATCICLCKVALTVHCGDCSTKLTHGMQSFREVVQHLYNMLRQVCLGSPLFRQIINL